MISLCDSKWKKLRVLHLHLNKITDEGALAILNNKW